MRPNNTHSLIRNVSFQTQWVVSWIITSIAIVASLLVVGWLTVRLGRSDFFTGYSLLATCVLLTFLSIRKRFLASPLGPVKIWLQIHIYTGILSLAFFVAHVGWFNGGTLEFILATVFLWIALSGLYVWYLSRSVPKKLLSMGRDIVFEDIPRLQQQYADEAYQIALSSTKIGEGVTLADYYQQRLVKYFHAPRGIWFGLFPTIGTRRLLLRELDTLDRYLNKDGRILRDQICEFVRRKDELDVHWAMQNRIRLCTTLHIAGLWMLVLLIVLRVTTVLAFAQRG